MCIPCESTFHRLFLKPVLKHQQPKTNNYWSTFCFCTEKKSNGIYVILTAVSEFNEFELRLKSAKTRFQLSHSLNLETLNTILSETIHIWAGA